jgi:multiple sugar transport system ATP-binding protein
MVLSDRIAVLCDGRVQQCDRPEAIYHAPANLFVATFVGSPEMNILPGALLVDMPALARHTSGISGAVVLGVRPTDVQVSAAPCSGSVAAEISVVEPTGPETWVTGEWRGARIKGRAEPGARIETGRTAWFAVPGSRIHLFDAVDGARLRRPAEPDR